MGDPKARWKAIPAKLGDIYLEEEIPGDPEKNRPNLVVINKSQEEAIIVDVTIPFEEEEDILQVQWTQSLVADAIQGGGGGHICHWGTGLLRSGEWECLPDVKDWKEPLPAVWKIVLRLIYWR